MNVLYPQAFKESDKYRICFIRENKEMILESYHSETKAQHALNVLNSHEKENGRPEKFYINQMEN